MEFDRRNFTSLVRSHSSTIEHNPIEAQAIGLDQLCIGDGEVMSSNPSTSISSSHSFHEKSRDLLLSFFQ